MVKIIQKWVKTLISGKEWDNYYSRIPSYCFLNKDGKNVWLGFLVANQCPISCLELSEEELLRVNEYRKSNNTDPKPLE